MTFFEPGGSTAPVDLQVPETFHRLKRTVLLFSSVLIVLSFADGDPDHALKLTFVDITLKTDIIRWLVWLAGAYYLFGFAIEARVVRLINSEAMLGAGMRTVDQALSRIATTISAHQDKMAFATKVIEDQTDSLSRVPHPATPSEVQAFMAHAQALVEDEKKLDRSVPNWLVTSEQLKRLADEGAFHNELERQRVAILSSIAEGIKQFSAGSEPLTSILQSTHSDLNRLSRRIHGDRRFSFWAWEIGGAGGAFILATAMNWPWIARNISAVIAFLS